MFSNALFSKFFIMFFLSLTLFASATPATPTTRPKRETNASRMARGLGPLPPKYFRRKHHKTSGVAFARRAQASPTPQPCSSGPVQCCNKTARSDEPGVGLLLGLLGIIGLPVDTLIGVQCSPLSVIGLTGDSCQSQPVCCSNNSFNGLVAIGCSPINVGL